MYQDLFCLYSSSLFQVAMYLECIQALWMKTKDRY